MYIPYVNTYFTFKETHFGKMSYVTEKHLFFFLQTSDLHENILLPGYLSCKVL